MESGSLCGSKCVIALRGMGVGTVRPLALFPAPPPPPPVDPGAGVVDEPARDVPPTDVLALPEIPVPPFAITFVLEPARELAERAELDVTVEAPNVVLWFPADRDDVEDALEETPFVADAVNNALPVDDAAPEPAPDDEPAVLDAVDEDEALVADD
jgi:hypothetical protein